tara:strand:+ start:1221 stop:1925 length:705 start_codon:yes stop_codon:yes gene_type:complete
MKILAVIPARGGSKGIKNKNIKNLCGHPLIAWTITKAKRSKFIEKVVVSTDSKKIAYISKKYGASVPFIRPKEYATDKANDFVVLKHAINFFATKGEKFDYIIMLQPTSPLRELKDINNSIKKVLKKDIDALVSVSKVEVQHPRFIYSIKNKDNLVPFLKKKNSSDIRRQDIDPLYFLEGSIYISKIKTLMKYKTFYHNKTRAYEVPKWKSLEIDDTEDLNLANFYIKNKKITL